MKRNSPAKRREISPGKNVQDSLADSTNTDTDSEGENPESIEDAGWKEKEMQELGWRAWGSKRKSSQLKASIVKAVIGGAATADKTDQSSM